MSAARNLEQQVDETPGVTEGQPGSPLRAAPEMVEVRRNGGVAAVVGVLASAVAIAYLGRAAQTGGVLDWLLAGVLGAIAVLHLRAFVDARTPLLVADSQGARIRLGHTWRGLPWSALQSVEHTPRRGLLRDGRLVLVPHNPDRILAELDAAGRRQCRVSRRLYGAPFALPLGLSTRVSELTEDLSTSLRQLTDGTVPVIEPVVEPERQPDAGPDEAERREDAPEPQGAGIPEDTEATEATENTADPMDPVDADDTVDTDEIPVVTAAEPEDSAPEDEPEIVASATPSPLRALRLARRVEVTSTVAGAQTDAPDSADSADGSADGSDDDAPQRTGRWLRRSGRVDLVEEPTPAFDDRVSPIARVQDPVEPLVLDDFEAVAAADPVIGPELAAARTRIGLTVDGLAERTRIRPHVIESIEVDDFVPCGGDFYARGHLRTLARVLGVESEPLLRSYDERYADAPINPRRVFEAELAQGAGGGIRSVRGGPNWSVLIAAVMTLVLAWSIARLVMDSPPDIRDQAPILNGSEGPANAAAPANVTLKVSASGSTHMVVRSNGKVVFEGDLEYGDVHRIDVTPPVRVQAADAGAIQVEINGEARGALGQPGQQGARTYRAD